MVCKPNHSASASWPGFSVAYPTAYWIGKRVTYRTKPDGGVEFYVEHWDWYGGDGWTTGWEPPVRLSASEAVQLLRAIDSGSDVLIEKGRAGIRLRCGELSVYNGLVGGRAETKAIHIANAISTTQTGIPVI